MSLKTYLLILKTGIYFSFISVFLVFTNLLFPYITSKQLYFNVLTEILAVFWLAVVIKYPEARPKKSYITFGLAAFFAALLASSVASVDFNLSFWGDVERMLGWFHIAHFFVFYLIIITAFRSWKDWRNLFTVSVAAAVLVVFYSLFKIPFSTIGNTAYVSGYAIFNIFFALILFFRRRHEEKGRHEDWLISALYLIAALVMFSVMRVTHTRGAYVGLGFSFLLFFILFALYSRSKKVKIYVFTGLAAALIAVSLVFSFPQSAVVRNSQILNTITQISSKQATFQTRLISWQAALKDFPNHPLLGAGYGNFAVTFDKYFDPAFYNYTSSETYFDRAHNNLVDLASTAGLLGLLSYLSIFAAVLYYLAKGKKQEKISTGEFILLLSLMAAYFIQNLAVFDSLVTYISLMIALGYVYWLSGKPEQEEEIGGTAGFNNKELAVLVVAGLISLAVIYQYNFKVWRMLDGTIKGQIQFAQGNIPAAAEQYKKALSFNTGLDRDSRASFINALNGRQDALLALDREKAKEIADYAVSLAEANVALNPSDSMMQMQLAQSLNAAAAANSDNQSKFMFYSDRALEAIDKSIAASPGRTAVYFTKAQIYIARDDREKAVNTLSYAFSLNEQYAEAACYLAKVKIYYKEEGGYADLDKCLDLGGFGYLSPLDFVKVALNHYTQAGDTKRQLQLYLRWSGLEPGNAKVWTVLAGLYEQAADPAAAINAARKAAAADPALSAAAEAFINKLGGEY
ncbi:MAG: O-antigen ligase family protein [bacterium]|nr:O-antigen ligase family protein [bacterium]